MDVRREVAGRSGFGWPGVVLVFLGVALAAFAMLLVFQDAVLADEAIPTTTVAGEQTTLTLRGDTTTDLVDGQTVTVTARNGNHHGGVVLLLCRADAEDLAGCDQASMVYPGGHSNNGRWTASVVVQRMVDTPSATIDCAVDACAVSAFVAYDQVMFVTSLELGFDASVAAGDRPEAKVRPRRSLVDGQEVEVSASGLRPFELVELMQCNEGGPLGGACSNYASIRAEVDGSGSTTMQVGRTINSYSSVSADCVEQRCAIYVRSLGRSPAPMVLQFDADVPPPAQPTVKLSKRRGLVDGDVVTVEIVPVEGADNRGHEYFSILQCGVQDGVPLQAECRYVGDGGNHGGEHDVPAQEELATVAVPQQGPGTTVAPPTTEPPAEPAPPATEVPAPPTTDVPPPSEPGAEPVDVVVRREIRSGHGEDVTVTDCGESTGRCVLVVQLDTGMLIASKGLSFDPDVPPAKANVVVTNTNKFVAGKTHRVKIENYLGSWVEVRQCPRDATSHEDDRCRILTQDFRNPSELSTERFTVRIQPVRSIGRTAGIDCFEKDTCDLRVFGEDGPMRRVLINFTGDEQTPTRKAQLKPKRQLADGQTVKLRIRGLPQESEYFVGQCVTNGYCEGIQTISEVRNDRGLVAEIAVQRFLDDTDCASMAKVCFIQVWSEPFDRPTDLPLRFTKAAPSDVGLKVSPRKNLGDQEVVNVVATVDGTISSLSARQCLVTEEGTGRCVNNTRLTGADGTLSRDFKVRRVIGGVDCADRVGQCEIQVVSGSYVRATKALGFDPSVALPEPVDFAMTVSPRKNLADGQAVEVEISGSPGWYSLAQCAVVDGEFAAGSCVYIEQVRRVPNDVQTTSVIVSREIRPNGATSVWDCALAADSCVLAVIDGHISAQPLLSVELTFDPDAERLVPEIVVTPIDGLTDGQTVTVSGSGWIPNFQLLVVPCVGELDELSLEVCEIDKLTPVFTDDNGEFSVEVTVSVMFNGQDCRVVICRLGVGDVNQRQTSASDRLLFS